MLIGILSHDIKHGYEEAEIFSKQYRADFFASRGVDLIVLDVLDFDFATMKFLRYKKQKSNSFAIVEEPVMPELIWSRTSVDSNWYSLVLQDCTHLFPSGLVSCLSSDKWYTYKAFPHIQPETYLLSHILHAPELISHREHDLIIKHRIGYGGHDVHKIALEDISTFDFGSKADDYIVQKYCDFTNGFPGLCQGNHDLRITFIGGCFAYSELRSNQEDFRVNVSLGGTCRSIAYDEIPSELKEKSSTILDKLGGEKTGVISMDFGFDALSQAWKLIEFNDSPGFTEEEFVSDTTVIDIAFQKYADVFLHIGSQKNNDSGNPEK